MKRRWIGSLLLISMCFLYGCSTKEVVADESEDTMAIVLENPQPDEKVSAVVYYIYEQELTNDLGEVVGSLYFKIPQLTLRSMEAGKINQDILAYYESNLADDFEFMSAEEWGSTEMPQLDRSIEAEVTYIDDSKICFLLLGYDYMGGAHGMPYRVPVIYDITTGEVLYAKDLFDVDEADFANMYIEAFDKMIAENPTEYWEDAGACVREMAVMDTIDFYLVESGVVFYQPPYNLGPYSTGFVDAEVSYEQLPLKK